MRHGSKVAFVDDTGFIDIGRRVIRQTVAEILEPFWQFRRVLSFKQKKKTFSPLISLFHWSPYGWFFDSTNI